MKVVLHYRHADGRMVELRADGAKAEVWLMLPHRELLSAKDSVDAAKAALPEGFELDASTFTPPCPKCNETSPMSLESGFYVCPTCETQF